MVEIWTKTPIKIPSKVPLKIIQGGSDFLTDILSPHRCFVCSDIILPRGSLICPSCMAKLSWVRRPVCKKCRKEVLDETIEYYHDCVRHKRSLGYGLSLVNYDDMTSRSMARVKYNNRRKYLDFHSEAMVGRMGERIRSVDGDALIPVPVHPSHLWGRGLNQAEELARRLSGPLEVPINTSVLKRERKTVPQKNLGSSDRLKDPEQAFTAAALPSAIQKVILVDDVYATGGTIEVYARIPRKTGTEHVCFVTMFTGHGQ